jgi:hypothetical protein
MGAFLACGVNPLSAQSPGCASPGCGVPGLRRPLAALSSGRPVLRPVMGVAACLPAVMRIGRPFQVVLSWLRKETCAAIMSDGSSHNIDTIILVAG